MEPCSKADPWLAAAHAGTAAGHAVGGWPCALVTQRLHGPNTRTGYVAPVLNVCSGGRAIRKHRRQVDEGGKRGRQLEQCWWGG